MRNRTEDKIENKIEIVCIRHGATISNELKKYLGKTEEALSEHGMTLIRQKKEEGKYPPVDIIAASPMKRCLQTAELIYGRQPSILIEEWKEIDFGSFEGKSYLELKENIEYQRWIDSGGISPFPEGESLEEFIKRCKSGFVDFCSYIKEVNPRPKTIAAIIHGGTIMSIVSSFLGEDKGSYFSYQCENGEGYRFEIDLEQPCLIQNIKKL